MDISEELYGDLDYEACTALETLIDNTVPKLSNTKRMALVSLLFPDLDGLVRNAIEAMAPFTAMSSEIVDDATDDSYLIPPPDFSVGEFRLISNAAWALKAVLGDQEEETIEQGREPGSEEEDLG